MLTIGQVLNEHTVIKSRGKGGFGEVYEVNSTNHNEPVALKICTSYIQNDKQRFGLENQILHLLQAHPHIILPLTEIRDEPPFFYYVMELADFNLEEFLKQAPVLELERKIELFRQICLGIKHAHENQVIHRDLWWNNVLLKSRGSGDYDIKLTDFGRAKAFTLGSISYSGVIWGMQAVMPPEICFEIWEQAVLDNYVRGDIYALGILFYFILVSAPATYYAELFSNIATFQSANSFTQQMTTVDKKALYEKWLLQNKGHKFGNLDVLVADLPNKTGTSAKINAIISKASHIDHKLRYSNMDEMIHDIDSI